jgi:hypothetical protein
MPDDLGIHGRSCGWKKNAPLFWRYLAKAGHTDKNGSSRGVKMAMPRMIVTR